MIYWWSLANLSSLFLPNVLPYFLLLFLEKPKIVKNKTTKNLKKYVLDAFVLFSVSFPKNFQ